MGVKSALSSVLSFFLGEEEASGSGLGEMGVSDLERRLEDIVRERERERKGTAGREKERKKWRRGRGREGEKAFYSVGEKRKWKIKLGVRFRSWAGSEIFFFVFFYIYFIYLIIKLLF